MKRVLFIDRDGTLIKEAPPTYQIDDWSKLAFYPDMFKYMTRIAAELDYELVMVTNQDGLGREGFPEEQFWPIHHFIMNSLESEGIHFAEVLIDKTFPEENSPNRKPGTGMLTAYLDNPAYDMENSFVIGDRITDMQLAKNLRCKGIWLNNDPSLGAEELGGGENELGNTIALATPDWEKVYAFLKNGLRSVSHERKWQGIYFYRARFF